MTSKLTLRRSRSAGRHWRMWAGVLTAALAWLPSFAAGQATNPAAASGSAWADPFAAYEARLNDAASRALENAAEREPKSTAVTATQKAEERPSLTLTRLQPQRGGWQRVEQLRPAIEPILRREGVPTELAAVVLVESGGRTEALSPKGARGLWQFMPETARRYGLVVSGDRDERLDVERSTRAAARYLRDLYSQFGNWPLAFAAYNAGEEAVQRAIQHTGSNDFLKLINGRSLPLETQQYVPAVVNAMQMFGSKGVSFPPARKASGGWILFAETHAASPGEAR
jgi:soluble lytic murein transglycosylase-like protein